MRSLVGYALVLIGFVVVGLPLLVLPFDLLATTAQVLVGLLICAIGGSLIYGARTQVGYFRDWDEDKLIGVGRIGSTEEKTSSYVKVESLEGRRHVRVLFLSRPPGADAPKIKEVREFVGRRRIR